MLLQLQRVLTIDCNYDLVGNCNNTWTVRYRILLVNSMHKIGWASTRF